MVPYGLLPFPIDGPFSSSGQFVDVDDDTVRDVESWVRCVERQPALCDRFLIDLFVLRVKPGEEFQFCCTIVFDAGCAEGEDAVIVEMAEDIVVITHLALKFINLEAAPRVLCDEIEFLPGGSTVKGDLSVLIEEVKRDHVRHSVLGEREAPHLGLFQDCFHRL